MNMSPRLQAFLAMLLTASATGSLAQVAAPSGATVVETGPGWGVATTTTTTSARVVAVDPASRRLDLLLADGRTIGLVAGAEVRRLDAIRAGDVVDVAYVEALVLELKKNGAAVVSRSVQSDVRRGPSAAAPSGVAQTETTVVADVLAVDRVSGTVTLRGPHATLNLRIRDPQQLARIAPGDQVQATYSEATAVSVDPVR
jgi:hypothetical protein